MTETMYSASEVAHYMVEFVKSRLSRQMFALGMPLSEELCSRVQKNYEDRVPKELRILVSNLEEIAQDGE